MSKKIQNRIVKTLSIFLMLFWILILGIPALAVMNPEIPDPPDDQKPADPKESGYWFDQDGAHLKPFTNEDLEEIDV